MSTQQKEASRVTSKKIKKLKDEKDFKEFSKAVKPVFDKKEGMKKELAIDQLEDAITKGDKSKLSIKGLEKVASAAADDRQLTKSLQKMERDLFRGGGRAGYKSGTRGCKLAKRGKGRAYGKNS
tara:strand:- start:92 stop:463 length:372 start_codon:yes stop_codon:yes gene_type:complete